MNLDKPAIHRAAWLWLVAIAVGVIGVALLAAYCSPR